MKRTFSALLALSLMLSLSACQSDDGTADTTPTDTDTQTVTAATTEVDIYAELPTGDFTGEEFVFANEIGSGSWSILMLDCENTGEVLDSAVFNRNRAVEEKLGITIKVEEYATGGALLDALNRNVMANEDPYDVYDIPANVVAPLILQDYFVDVDTLGLDLEKPWWNDTVMDSLSFNDTCYSIAGDLSIMLWEASYGLVYNKDMAERLGIPDQYELVKDGKFTLDSVYEAMSLAYQDDGNSEVDSADTFGMTGNLRLMTYSMIAGGESIIPKDSDGLPYFEAPSERLIEMYEKIFDVYFDNTNVCLANKLVFKDKSKNWHSIFTDGQALYYFEPIGSNVKLRDVNFDFVFLPMPKYDEAQAEYITPILQFAHTMHVTKANDNHEMISVVLENLAAESHRNVRPAYFEKVLEGKRTSDDRDIEMFDIIFDNQVFNPAAVYNWGKMADTLNNTALSGKREITSSIASITSVIQSDIKATIEYYS
ncbi:MAG: extracellular solute-binding protein [Clostridia bacterium]|nr:extracellular solute-binding protein [Clostridia bacterium]